MSNYTLSEHQERVVDKIVENAEHALNEAINNSLNKINKNYDLLVDAVTGSGKTLMMTTAISRILNNNKDKNIIVIVATPSISDLHSQIFNKMEKYCSSFALNDQFEFELILSPSKTSKNESRPILKPENHKVFIIGKSSFTKASLYNTTGAFSKFIEELSGFNVVYFRDEAHYGNNRSYKDFLDFDSRIQNLAIFNCFLSATPNYESHLDFISLTSNDLLNDNIKLLKSNKYEFIKDDNKSIESITDETLLENAIAQFQEIKKEYIKNEININPAMLIQINNDTDPKRDLKKHEQFNKNLEMIIDYIKNKCTPQNSLKYYITFDTDANILKTNSRYDKLSFDELSQNNSDIDIIIFKVGAAIGWDIPRANMLVQLRKVNSENLQTQTVGRIMRFPNPHNKDLYYKKCLDKYYIFSNVPVNSQQRYSYKIKDKFINDNTKNNEQKFLISEINNYDDISSNHDCSKIDIINKIKKDINDNLNKYVQWLADIYSDNKIIIDQAINNSNKRFCYLTIHNKLQLKIYNDKIAAKNYHIFEIIDELNKDYPYSNELKKYDWEQFRYLLWKKLSDDIRNQLYLKRKEKEPTYTNTELVLSRNTFTEIIDNNKVRQCFVNTEDISDYYFFERTPENINQFYLDSFNEVIVFNQIKKFIINNKNNKNIKIICFFKNPTNSGIGMIEYIDNNVNKHIEHVDFILRFSVNNIIKTLYIEVKGGTKENCFNKNIFEEQSNNNNNNNNKNIDDYNEQKTMDILNSFKIICSENNNNFYLSLVYVDSLLGKDKNNPNNIRTRVLENNNINTENDLQSYLNKIFGIKPN